MLIESGLDPNSFHYVFRGPLLIHAVHDFRMLQLFLATGDGVDPTYQRKDGLIDSYAGEVLREAAALGGVENIELLVNVGAQCQIPPNEPGMVVGLEHLFIGDTKFEILFVPNATFEAAQNDLSPKEILRILLENGIDINELDCVIGYSQGERYHLEYCTALDSLESPDKECKSCMRVYPYSRAIYQLQEFGGMILPRY